MNEFSFTMRRIGDIPTPTKRTYYRDTRCAGLTLNVYPSGKKVFYLYRRIDGKPERLKLGSYPELHIDHARDAVAEMNGTIAKGNNPADSRRLKRAELTFSELFDDFMEFHSKPHKKTWAEDQRQFDAYLTSLAKKKVSDITKRDIASLHVQLGEKSGYYTANRVLALIHSVFNKGIDRELLDCINPASRVKKFKEKSRERFLQKREARAFFTALRSLEESMRHYFLMLLYTGVRPNNVQSMRWEDIDFEHQLWQIPDTKNGFSHTMPLVDPAIALLRRRENNGSPWVFPSSRSKAGHITEPKKAWNKLRQESGLKDLQMRDLRRSLASWQAIQGHSLVLIGKTLGHKSPNATSVYARLNTDPVRHAIGDALSAIHSAAWDED